MDGSLNRNSYKHMKNIFAALFLALTLTAPAADVSVTISNVHLCCGSCVRGVTKAAASVPQLTAKTDMKADTVTLTGPDAATVQKGADALVAAGYFGESSDPSIKMTADSGAKNQTVQTIKIEGVHLCCGKCDNAVKQALKTVPGVADVKIANDSNADANCPITPAGGAAAAANCAITPSSSATPAATGTTPAASVAKKPARAPQTVEVTGNFNDKDVFDALQKAGFSGREK